MSRESHGCVWGHRWKYSNWMHYDNKAIVIISQLNFACFFQHKPRELESFVLALVVELFLPVQGPCAPPTAKGFSVKDVEATKKQLCNPAWQLSQRTRSGKTLSWNNEALRSGYQKWMSGWNVTVQVTKACKINCDSGTIQQLWRQMQQLVMQRFEFMRYYSVRLPATDTESVTWSTLRDAKCIGHRWAPSPPECRSFLPQMTGKRTIDQWGNPGCESTMHQIRSNSWKNI